MRDTCATSWKAHGPLKVTLAEVNTAGRSMMQIGSPDEAPTLTLFANDAVLARLALELINLLDPDVIAEVAVELNAEWAVRIADHAIATRRRVVPADDPFGTPTTDLTAAELGAQS